MSYVKLETNLLLCLYQLNQPKQASNHYLRCSTNKQLYKLWSIKQQAIYQLSTGTSQVPQEQYITNFT